MNIAITGKGIVTAIGRNTEEVCRSLKNGRTGIGRMTYLNSTHKELPVGEVKMTNEEMKRRLRIDEKKEISRTTLMGMIAVQEAIETGNVEKGERVVLISGTTVGGMDLTELHYKEVISGERPEFMAQHDTGSCTENIAKRFEQITEWTTISTACSSAANAIAMAADMIKSDEADIVIAGGTEALSKFHLNGFNSLMILDKEICKPFDNDRNGLNLGEGAAYVVIESEKHAKDRGQKIEAYLTGYANACDAYHQTATSENGDGAYKAMTEAIEMAGIDKREINYINAHGTGTPDNDKSETNAIKRIFGDETPETGSTKSYTGHTTSASGSIETVISIIAMTERFIPKSLNWKTKIEGGITPTEGKTNVEIENAMCNSFGFGGNDTSLIISQTPKKEQTERKDKLKIRIVSQAEITDKEGLTRIKEYVNPMEARRMGKLMKAAMITSMKAINEAGIEMPDAIITGTKWGCLESGEQILDNMEENGEEMIKPTQFMQSTHNTIGSAIAIKLKCHGYNTTYTQGDRTMEWAMRDAEMLLRTGRYKYILVGCHDEGTEKLTKAIEKCNGQKINEISSKAMIVTCGE